MIGSGGETGRRLAVMRIAFGTILLMYQTGLYGLSRMTSLSLGFPRHRFSSEADYYLARFHLPVPGFEWLPVPSLWGYCRLEDVAFLLSLAWTCGLTTRLTGPLLSLLWSYFLLISQIGYQHFYYLLCLVILILGMSPTSDFLSVDAILTRQDRPREERSILPVRLLQSTVSIVYAFSVLSKLNQGWLGGQIIGILRDEGVYTGPFAPWVLAATPPRLLSLFTLAVEGFLIFGLWVRSTRRAAVLMGILLHVGIDALMPVATYSYQMIALYLAFVEIRSPIREPVVAISDTLTRDAGCAAGHGDLHTVRAEGSTIGSTQGPGRQGADGHCPITSGPSGHA
jgi:hypothetical protein